MNLRSSSQYPQRLQTGLIILIGLVLGVLAGCEITLSKKQKAEISSIVRQEVASTNIIVQQTIQQTITKIETLERQIDEIQKNITDIQNQLDLDSLYTSLSNIQNELKTMTGQVNLSLEELQSLGQRIRNVFLRLAVFLSVEEGNLQEQQVYRIIETKIQEMLDAIEQLQ